MMDLINWMLFHYVDIDSETVFDICSNELEELEKKIIELKDILSTSNK